MKILNTPQKAKAKYLMLIPFIYLILCSVTILAQEAQFRLIKQETTDSEGVRTWFIWEYDKNNRCIKEQYDTTADFYGHTITYSYDGSGKKIKIFKQIENGAIAYEIYIYNAKQLISKKEVKTEVGHHTVTTYEYDDHGNMVKSHEVNIQDSSPVQTILCTYNADNQLARKEIQYFNGGMNTVTTYTYNESGNLVKDSCSWEGTDRVYENMYYYDGRGRKIKHIQGYKGAEKNTTMTWTYDAKNRLMKYTQTGSSDMLKTYEYDNKGNVIKEFQDNGGYSFTHTHTYDTYGNRTKTVFNDSKGKSRTTLYMYAPYEYN
jgi:YD repeat-containing protein